ncbi:uncharacterized protein LOC106135491 [Amyelois transitella]|uniref:uncharacterized protein LOC106135491 n=1 Tax=Amyelois transitella TaxID=680683 RepID=UPI00067C745B|nr:uncharacterized protein LOC106135491 [Amyelois transitella]XP_013191259.1 uncharacterized protein LOC106135491 [Amyelois transitella]XP_013191260.1 uncharacterized protein LOC106135491 [Amyelois transitella]XP_060803578.1 uncharacterized protein LOC106135491 [Amyelois transitella]
MGTHEKPIGNPKTPYELFLKLYCKKKGLSCDKNNILLAAVKAWITLNEDERKTFTQKFIECKEKHQNQIAFRLEKLKPYMKKKPNKRSHEICKSYTFVRRVIDQPIEERPSIICEQDEKTANTSNINCSLTEECSIQEPPNSTKLENEMDEIVDLSEPAPPNVRNAVDLFHMIKNKKEDDSEWSCLTNIEKMRYRRAVYQLKKDYIQNYKMFLESLPLKELFKYYHKFDTSS